MRDKRLDNRPVSPEELFLIRAGHHLWRELRAIQRIARANTLKPLKKDLNRISHFSMLAEGTNQGEIPLVIGTSQRNRKDMVERTRLGSHATTTIPTSPAESLGELKDDLAIGLGKASPLLPMVPLSNPLSRHESSLASFPQWPELALSLALQAIWDAKEALRVELRRSWLEAYEIRHAELRKRNFGRNALGGAQR